MLPLEYSYPSPNNGPSMHSGTIIGSRIRGALLSLKLSLVMNRIDQYVAGGWPEQTSVLVMHPSPGQIYTAI